MGEPITFESVLRPWGGYVVIEEGVGYKVKRIWVHPGEILSHQMHEHRDEHWVIVMGSGEVTLGDETILKKKNEATFIPARTKHRIANPGQVQLEFIEVQTGDYLGEDDIVRFEDRYGRTT